MGAHENLDKKRAWNKSQPYLWLANTIHFKRRYVINKGNEEFAELYIKILKTFFKLTIKYIF